MRTVGQQAELELGELRQLLDVQLERLLPAPEGPAATLNRAMHYSVLGGGKRLRPILAMASCEACGGTRETVIESAAALELVHTYSLIHDDLPAMDDDDLRRGRPTVHKAFDEAVAILAGDALLTLAFEILGGCPAGEDHAARRADAVLAVARRIGALGMVGGQMADLEAERTSPDSATVDWIHKHKTGALFSASAELGAIHAGADKQLRAALARFGEQLGLAFQITDDILDRVSTAGALGKTPGKDLEAGKSTYPALYGIEGSRSAARRRVESALAELDRAGCNTRLLEALAHRVVDRSC